MMTADKVRERSFSKSGSRLTINNGIVFQTNAAAEKPLRSATPGDGVTAFSPEELRQYESAFREAAATGRIRKILFSQPSNPVFDLLEQWLKSPDSGVGDNVGDSARSGHPLAIQVREFMQYTKRFAFADALREIIDQGGNSLDQMLKAEKYAGIVLAILHEDGLGYGHKPLALQTVAWQSGSPVTALEQQLSRSADTICDDLGHIRISVGCPNQQMEMFRTAINEFRPVNQQPDQHFDLQIFPQFQSGQHHDDGSLLVSHLENMQSDIAIFQDFQHPLNSEYYTRGLQFECALGGMLVELQRRIHYYLDRLVRDYVDNLLLTHMIDFSKARLGIRWPDWAERGRKNEKIEFLINKFNRPIRVCGVVPGLSTPQRLIWKCQEEGLERLAWSTEQPKNSPAVYSHTANMVCGLRDFRGRRFSLSDFTALGASGELQGSAESMPEFWDNLMGEWTSVFVELPVECFGKLHRWTDLPLHSPERKDSPRRRHLTSGISGLQKGNR